MEAWSNKSIRSIGQMTVQHVQAVQIVQID
jgi:hypothetical protein